MVYHQHGMHVSKVQARKLIKGQGIKVTHRNIKGGQSIYLTKTQLNKMTRAHASGKGAMLRLSSGQIKHNAKHGAGFLSFLGSALSNPLVQDVAKIGINYGLNKMQGRGARPAPRKRTTGKGFLSSLGKFLSNDTVQSIGKAGINYGLNRMQQGSGVRKKRRATKRKACSRCAHGGSFKL